MSKQIVQLLEEDTDSHLENVKQKLNLISEMQLIFATSLIKQSIVKQYMVIFTEVIIKMNEEDTIYNQEMDTYMDQLEMLKYMKKVLINRR